MTLSRLSLRNAKRQTRDYLVYFVTIVLAAALIYAFNELVFSEEIRSLSNMLRSMPFFIVLTSIAVVLIIGWLISYTVRFMLAKRSRELGTYILLGMENKQVAQLFFWENLVVGGVAIAFGTLLGNLIFQALRAITLALFRVPYTFRFAFSIRAVLLTLFYFALIYLFALLKSRKRIKRMKIYDLLYLDKRNEEETIRKSRSRRGVFMASILFGIAGTVLLLLRHLPLALIGAMLIIASLYGFFLSFSSGVPDYFNKRPHKKYHGSTLIVFRSLSSKLSTMGVVMATISMLFAATLIAEGSGLIFQTLFQSRTDSTTCYDLLIGTSSRDANHFDDYDGYINENIPVVQDHRYPIYLGDDNQMMAYIQAKVDYTALFEYDTLMSYSDYAALREMLNYPPAKPLQGEYLIHCMPYLEDTLSTYGEPVFVGGREFAPSGQLYTESFTQSLWDGNGHGYLLVLPDAALAGQPISHSIYAAMTSAPVSETDYEELGTMRDAKENRIDGYDTVFSRAAIAAENISMYAIVVYPLYYLALVLTMVAATILTIQLLSETGRYRQQYRLLENLGMERREMRRALSRQFALFYTMPAIPPLLISVPFIFALGGALDPGVLTGVVHLWSIVGITLALFFAIYLVYVLAAYISFKRTVLPQQG